MSKPIVATRNATPSATRLEIQAVTRRTPSRKNSVASGSRATNADAVSESPIDRMSGW
jgi:hypothetical protein